MAQVFPLLSLYWHFFCWKDRSKFLPKSTDIPIFEVISETYVLPKLVVEKPFIYKFLFYAMFTGFWRALAYFPAKNKIFANRPAKHF